VVSGLPFHLQALKTVSEMKIIEIKFTKKFGGAWCAFEAPGVAPSDLAQPANKAPFWLGIDLFGGFS